ncbi:sodium-dependent phosphate transport protein 2B-like [Styela clava]
MGDIVPADTGVEGGQQKSEKELDPYELTEDYDYEYQRWNDKTMKEKIQAVIIGTTKLIVVLGCLYLFICSLGLMGSAFQVLAGKTAGDIFTKNEILSNPITGLIIGILVTVLVQSSSTSTSIFITMTSVDLISVRSGVPLIMGANIGTSVTNTIVSLTQSADREEFRRSFAGATIHDIFNLLCVLVLLPIELIFHYLEKLTGAILYGFTIETGQKPPDLLKVLTKPLTSKIISVNKTVITYAALDQYLEPDSSMVKIWCERDDAIIYRNESVKYFNDTGMRIMDNETDLIGNRSVYSLTEEVEHKIKVGTRLCDMDDFLFANTGITDAGVGAILLIISLVAMCICLTGMVKLLSSMLKGNIARIIKKVINTNFPYPFGWLTGYLAILVGAGLTFLVQSSSVFTSTITPLVGIGVISLKRMLPLTLGSNIGTTTTGLLAALASSGNKLHHALQLSLCHFFFNITGILIWYPIPHMRNIPIKGAKALGNKTAKHRWFAVVYLIFVFFLIPTLVLGLSIADEWALWGFLIAVALVLIPVIILSILQSKIPKRLPEKLRTWEFLPLWMHSLKPYSSLFGNCCSCRKNKRRTSNQIKKEVNGLNHEHDSPEFTGMDNIAYENENTSL